MHIFLLNHILLKIRNRLWDKKNDILDLLAIVICLTSFSLPAGAGPAFEIIPPTCQQSLTNKNSQWTPFKSRREGQLAILQNTHNLELIFGSKKTTRSLNTFDNRLAELEFRVLKHLATYPEDLFYSAGELSKLESSRLKEVLATYANRFPKLLPPVFVANTRESFQLGNTNLRLAEERIRLSAKSIKPVIETPYAVFSQATSIPIEIAASEDLERDARKVFYERVLLIQKNLSKPAFGLIRMNPKLGTTKEFRKINVLLFLLADLKVILGNSDQAWMKIIEILRQKSNEEILIESGNLSLLTEKLIGFVNLYFRDSLFELDSDQRNGLSVAEVNLLRTEWLNPDSLGILMSRFTANPKWQKEIPIVKKIAQASASGKFKQLKYFGDLRDSQDQALAQDQLRSLNEVQKTLWMTNEATAQVYRTSPTANEATSNKDLRLLPPHQLSVVLTVRSDDPSFLLNIGKLTGNSTCLDPVTGESVFTLPAYAVDANIQALASFALQIKDFDRAKDFAGITNALLENTVKQVHFSGNKMIATFEMVSGEKISSKRLPYAFLRNVLKLGRSTKTQEPALVLETNYKQTHLLSKEMITERNHYVRDLANRLNVRWQDDITVPKTRNPLGQYSDEGCIIATQEYTLPNNHDF
ncbi:MAG TPA: hypothetical protein PLU50_01295 [Pseudobdellovibrionaceae bacterium]|nr:hypothetical protein [Pseudobdellovibrionaceae bacterium]